MVATQIVILLAAAQISIGGQFCIGGNLTIEPDGITLKLRESAEAQIKGLRTTCDRLKKRGARSSAAKRDDLCADLENIDFPDDLKISYQGTIEMSDRLKDNARKLDVVAKAAVKVQADITTYSVDVEAGYKREVRPKVVVEQDYLKLSIGKGVLGLTIPVAQARANTTVRASPSADGYVDLVVEKGTKLWWIDPDSKKVVSTDDTTTEYVQVYYRHPFTELPTRGWISVADVELAKPKGENQAQ